MNPIQLFDPDSCTYTYVLFDVDTRDAVIIDPVDEQLVRDLQVLREYGLRLQWVIETHAHADHITSALRLAEHTGAHTAAPAACGIATVHRALHDGDEIPFGAQRLRALATPGHTAGSMSYVWQVDGQTHVFTGDTLLIGGCGRTDFQNGDAGQLYDSVTQTLFTLPDDTVVYPAHDYRGFTASTIGEEKRYNTRLAGNSRDKFVEIMGALGLPPPAKLAEAVPANRSCGFAPPPHQDDAAAAVAEITPAAALEARGTARLVDVREADELTDELGRIPGSEHVPLAALSETSRTWDKRQPIIVICRSGNRSRRAAETLVRGGFERVLGMAGGMLAYRAAGLPTER